tara:strand:- start:413 stop:1549 length:1137 start_codon:yes stop_codon:yes gene_type:complete
LSNQNPEFDITIIGAGVVGLAIAKYLSEETEYSVLVVEKNDAFGTETSSRNSEVIHSGIFNNIDSLKYKFCIEGNKLLYNFCKENKIWFNKCEKIIVSKKEDEGKLQQFIKSLIEKNIDFELLDSKQTEKIEPNIFSEKSVLIKNSGVVDSHDFMNHLFRISSKNHTYIFDSNPKKIIKNPDSYTLHIERKNGEVENIQTKVLINSAGLGSYNIAYNIMKDSLKIPKMKFYKGSYFSLSTKWTGKFNKLIYSLPQDDDSLGIHISFDATNRSKLGPDYEYIEENNFDYSVDEAGVNKFFISAKEYIKDLKIEDLNADYSGIRPKLFYSSNLYSDFYIAEESSNGYKNLINLIGIDSPGLTSSLSIGKYISSIVYRMNL